MKYFGFVLFLTCFQSTRTQTIILPDCLSGNETPSCVNGGAVINNGSVSSSQIVSISKLTLMVLNKSKYHG